MRLSGKFSILAVSWILLAMPALGHSRPLRQSPPAATCSGPEFHQFDFWLGRWQVFGPTNKLSANVTVSSELGGCALIETWTPLSAKNGHGGRGMSTYNTANQKWEYFWIASNAYTSYWTGELHGQSMQFTAMGPSAGAAAMRHWNMTLMPDGRIQEQAFFSQDNGKTWKSQYILYWKRVK